MKKRKLKKEAKLLLLLMVLLLIVILLIIAVNAVVFKGSNSQNNVFENNIKENIAQKEKEEENIIKVVIDDKKNDDENNKNNENNNNSNNNENNNNPISNEQGEGNVDTNNDNKVDTTKKDKNTYYIKINNKANVVTIYTKDTKGKYTVPVKAMICSIGTATPKSGVYRTSDMYTWRLLQGDVYGQYAVRITGHILFHSVPYQKRAKDTLEWWEYDKLGTDASLGCIRLTVEDAKWIYDNCPKGTQVEFYYSSDPGPLGKPTSKKISSYDEKLKKWDPTDPDSKNPWKTYVETGAPSEESATKEETPPVNTIDQNNNQNTMSTNTISGNI